MADRVLFRAYRDTGEVIAVLPDCEANPGLVVCYQHVGQHGEGLWSNIRKRTRRAYSREYAPLLAELTSIGYELSVRAIMPPARG
jgi:hypothetical protein